MPTLSIDAGDGSAPRQVDVDYSFLKLSPDQQEATVNEIAASLKAAQSTPGNSIGGDLAGGLHDAGTSVSQGLKAIGGVMSRNGMPEWGGDVASAGGWVANRTPNAPAGPAPSEQLADAIRNRQWSAIPGLLAHSAIRAVPSTAAILGTAALAPEALAPAVAGAAAGGLALGPEAYARAANNGRSEPTTGDVLGAIPGAAGEAIGGALLPGGSKLASPIARAAAKVGQEAAGGAIMDASGQLGASVGTDKGTQLDPYQVAASGITQGVIGAGRVAKDAMGAGVRSVTGQTLPPLDALQASSIQRINDILPTVKDGMRADHGGAVTDEMALNSLRKEVDPRVRNLAAEWLRNGYIDGDAYRTVVMPAVEAAARHNSGLWNGTEAAPSALDKLNALRGVPPDQLAHMNNALADLDNLSVGSRMNRSSGPLQSVGRTLGTTAGIAAGIAGGAPLGPPGMIAGGLAGLAGHRIESRLGGYVGQKLDQALGWGKPLLVRQAQNAADVLEKSGTDPGPNTLASLDAALAAARTSGQGTPAPAGTLTAARRQLAIAQTLGPDHPVGQAAFQGLVDSGREDLAAQAMDHWNSMANVRDAKDRAAAAAQAAQEQAAQDAKDTAAQAKRDQQVRRSDAEAAFSDLPTEAELERARSLQERAADRVSGMAYRMDRKAASGTPDAIAQRTLDRNATNNEAALRAVDMVPNAPDVGIDAINAAVRQAEIAGERVKRLAGSSEAMEDPPALTPAATPPEAPQPVPAPAATAPPQASGLLPLGDYVRHLALTGYGRDVSPDHVRAGLDALTASGGLTPDQYAFYKAALASPLQNPGGVHTPFIDAIARHAVGAKSGEAVPPGATEGKLDQSGIRNKPSYVANLRQEEATARSIIQQHPELADMVNAIRDPEANGKTKAGRAAILAQLLRKVPKGDVARVGKILRPLTGYGQGTKN